ncbi:MAG: molybdate ABC transporter substrate-binding protein [Candidatus Pelagadaptatus aseana]|uniref:molybdate ABC transporter substrate-binding protein n=1 Tax=Candidatus Pelagadaptatus aseana TaxID=3120508 RepID=UPI0039B2E695
MPPIYIACAANFFVPLKQLVADYKARHAPEANILISSGSSGSLYRQIKFGSPHQLFLSADRFFPQQLEREQLVLTDSRQTYAIGQLVFWQPGLKLESLDELTSLQSPLAIANPKTAPYGQAAREVLNRLAPNKSWQLITGTSIAQTHQFISSGNVPAGFTSRSLIPASTSAVLEVPSEWHQPLIQQMVLTRKAKDQPQATQLFAYLSSPDARTIIKAHGYLLPEKPALKEAQQPL